MSKTELKQLALHLRKQNTEFQALHSYAERFFIPLHTKEKLIYPQVDKGYRSTMPAQEGTEKSDTGAGTAKSLSVPQLSPIFSFHSEGGGDVYIYVFETDVATFLVATFDDTASEEIWATSSSSNVTDLLIEASREWDKVQVGGDDDVNPFHELLHDKEAMNKLRAIIAQLGE